MFWFPLGNAVCDYQNIKLKEIIKKRQTGLFSLSSEDLLKVKSGLIFVLFLLILVDLEVAQLVALLGVGHHPQPVPQVVFLQVLLGQILKVPETDEDQHLLVGI